MCRMKTVIGLAGLVIATTAGAGVTVREPVNSIAEGNFASGKPGGPPPKPWQCSKSSDAVRVSIETPADRGESERWVRLVDDSDRQNANLRQAFAPVSGGRFQARVICRKEGGRLFFNFGSGSASKPEERAFQLVIEADGSLVARGEKKAKTSMRIAAGEVYLVWCDFEPVGDGKALRVTAGLTEERTQRESRAEVEVATAMAVSAVRVTSTGPDTGVDYFVTDLSLAAR